jgi:hypothetical protein
MPWGSEYPPLSKERAAEIDRRIDESFYQQYLQNEKDWLESCEWGHEGENCDCKEIVKEMREQREKWLQETLKKREQASEEAVSEEKETPKEGTGASDETVSEVGETPKEGTGASDETGSEVREIPKKVTGPSEEAVSDEW